MWEVVLCRKHVKYFVRIYWQYGGPNNLNVLNGHVLTDLQYRRNSSCV